MRLRRAFEDGLAFPVTGRIAVFRPPDDASLPGVPRDQCDIIHDFKPSHTLWTDRGYRTLTAAEDRYAAAIVCLPRSKTEARALISKAVSTTSGVVVIDGQKTDGIDAILKQIRTRVAIDGTISKAHGKLFLISAAHPETFEDWAVPPARTAAGFWTAPGVFSAENIDLASALLVDVLPHTLSGHVADFGAGWGFLSAHLLTRPKVERVHLVEAGFMALECARRNVADPRAIFHWADVRNWAPPRALDAVIMNPPFHQGRAAEPELGVAFINAASQVLTPQGELWMVANRHLPYEAALKQTFMMVKEVGKDARFKRFHAARPVRLKRSKR
ncbi:MAG: class I SAM-dependent methyltransferase [Pseudomonadota bacterium]